MTRDLGNDGYGYLGDGVSGRTGDPDGDPPGRGLFYVAFPRDVSHPAQVMYLTRKPTPADLPAFGWVEGPFDDRGDAYRFAVAARPIPQPAMTESARWPKGS